MKKYILFPSFFLFFLFACKQQYEVVSMKGSRTEINSSFTPQENTPMQTLVNHYKMKLDVQMNQIIGQSSQEMPFTRGESLLTNLTSDVMLRAAGGEAEIALMNVNGHRANLPKGDITVGNIFEIYSFDNALVIVKAKGNVLKEVFESYARMGGAGVSSTVKLEIDKAGNLLSALVNGKPIDPNKTYSIVTLDYLAEGNDGMEALKKADSVTPLGLVLRDVMLDYVKGQTTKGQTVTSVLDGRITIKN